MHRQNTVQSLIIHFGRETLVPVDLSHGSTTYAFRGRPTSSGVIVNYNIFGFLYI